jgi:MoaA/NifB/PqqE/SkfB family radical SAM enzyme
VSILPFDEAFYLRVYPDVAEAVRSGAIANAHEHYVRFGEQEGRKPAQPLEELLSSPTTETVFLELTSRCNLRCVYCAVSQPTYHGIDLPLKGFDNFLGQMRERGVRIVVMNGHGESTIIKDWDVYADRLADAGIRLHMTTNMAKRLTGPEVAVLSRFERILVSLDTVDPQLLTKLRRGANLDTILANVDQVQQFAAARYRAPQMTVSCTVGDLSAPAIPGLVDAFLARDVKTFRFGDLAEYPVIEGVTWMRHVSMLTPPDLAAARAGFRAALERIEEAGGTYEIDQPLVTLLVTGDGEVGVSDRATEFTEKTVHYVDAGATQTRDCLDPWRIAFVNADASVRPCCFFEEKLGTLLNQSLPEIVEGAAYRKLREEMLTGELRPNCRSCSARPLIDRTEFQAKLSAYLASQHPNIPTS